jgi:hypothetical protein
MNPKFQVDGQLGNLLEPVSTLTAIILGISIILAFIAFRKLQGSIRLLVAHMLLSYYVELMGLTTQHTPNHLIFVIYVPFDFALMLFATQDYIRSIFRPFAIICTLIFSTLYINSVYRNGLNIMPFDAIVPYWCMLVVAWFLVLLFNTRRRQSSETSGIYVLSTFIMLFYGCAIPVWGMFHFNTIHHMQVGRLLQEATNAFSLARYLFTGIGLLMIVRKPRGNDKAPNVKSAREGFPVSGSASAREA